MHSINTVDVVIYVYTNLDFFVSALSLKEDKNVNTFMKSLSSHLTSSLHYGHIDIFAPLTTSGMYTN